MLKRAKSRKTGIGLSAALDEAPLSVFHFKALFTSGMGFFTDAYDLFIIGIAVVLIKEQWHLNTTQVSLLGSATLLATLLGAFVFGRIADLMGRKAVYGLEATIMAVAAIASAFAPNFYWLVLFRFLLGLGIGGDYPVSAVIMSEYSNRVNRGFLVSLVFSMQALGLVIGPMVALTLLVSGISHDLAWRIMLGLGALPAIAVIQLRRSMPESPRFVARVKGDLSKAVETIHHYSAGIVQASKEEYGPTIKRSFKSFITRKRNLLMILGTAGSWFLLDYAYYGNTISTPLILKTVAPGSDIIRTAAWTLIIFAIAALPGYAFAFFKIDHIGHKRLQWIGFIAMGICFFIIGIVPGLTEAIVPFLILYGLSYFFTEFGPNVTTFVIPTEVFSITDRSTGHGIAAGIGKLGAFLGVFIFPMLTAKFALSGTLLISSVAAFLGALATTVLPETSRRSLDEVSEELIIVEQGPKKRNKNH
ncbi:MAG TPA: MFS transporter [Patescibacteria group bacterium]